MSQAPGGLRALNGHAADGSSKQGCNKAPPATQLHRDKQSRRANVTQKPRCFHPAKPQKQTRNKQEKQTTRGKEERAKEADVNARPKQQPIKPRGEKENKDEEKTYDMIGV